MKHKNFPYKITKDYKTIYEFLNNHPEFFLIGFTEGLPNHMFKMRKSIHTGEVIIVDSHLYMNHAQSVEDFEKICDEQKLYIIEPEKQLK